MGEVLSLANAKVDPREVMEDWWNESAENEASMNARLCEFVHQLEHEPADKIIVVGHSHFFRAFFKRKRCTRAQPTSHANTASRL